MTSKPEPLDDVLGRAQILRLQREGFEASLAECRRQSRSVAMTLIFDYAYSLARVSALTGHMRPTLRVWIEVEAARRDNPGFKPIKELHELDTPE